MIFYLIGYMGAGKSSIGREVAKRTGMRFVDMDKEIEKMHGMAVTEIFRRQGEQVFRKSERAVLEQLADGEGDVVVATGGGVPCYGDNMDVLNNTGKTIYLKLTPQKLVRRLMPGQARRPKLHGMNEGQVLEYVERMLPEREEYYMRAQMIIDCDAISDGSICDHVVEYVRYYAEAGGDR